MFAILANRSFLYQMQFFFVTKSSNLLYNIIHTRGTMFGKLLPKEPRFFDLFEKHASLILEAAQLLHEAVLKWNPDINRINPIKNLEHEADEITHQCIEELRKSFITPLQQEDIFRLISKMDDVIDGIHEVFEDCIIYKIPFFPPDATHLVRLLVSAVEKVALIISQLRERKKEAKHIREKILQIHIVENQADEVLRQALGKLFDEEEDLRMVIKWKEIYEELESSIDFCEDVSNIVEGIILEYD